MQNRCLNVISLALVNLFALVSASVATAAASQPNPPAKAAAAAPGPTAKTIPWDQIGAKAGAIYQGGGPRVTPTAQGARLHCGFQRLDGEATRDGLWLTSTVSNTVNDRFRIVAQTVGRQVLESGSPLSLSLEPNACQSDRGLPLSKTLARLGPPLCLPLQGTVFVTENVVRFVRLGLVEEYSVSMDGVRQDFVMTEKPAGEGDLRVGLAVSGARVEAMPGGARLVLERSGRKIAYSRLRATDATGKELAARIEVIGRDRFHSVPEIKGNAVERVPASARLAIVVEDAGAVYPVRIDPTFSDENWISMDGLPGTDGDVKAAVVDGAGNLYIGGEFTAVGDVIANFVAKWNGTRWSALGSGMNGVVVALAVSGSDLYAGGGFTAAGGGAANCIAKWNGTSWSPLGSGMNSTVRALAVSGSDVYASGDFTTAGESAANYVAKWNGSSWSALGSGLSGGYANTAVYALAVSGSDLYAGGDFSAAGGSLATHIAKWNGSSWSALGSGMVGYVSALAVSGSDVYAGGGFRIAGSSAANSIAKWNGSSWSALGSGMNAGVYALAVSGSDVYAGGYFGTAGGSAANSIAKWNGSSWSALGSGMNNEVDALAVSGSEVYAGGVFRSAGGSPVNYIAKWNGSTWSALGSGMNNYVSALAASGSDMYAGGWFTTATNSGGAAVTVNGIAKWNGSTWSALGSGVNGQVWALAVSGNELYAGGSFTTAGGSAATNIAKWNGSSWSALGSGVNNRVYALVVSGGDVYAGGTFRAAGGSAANSIAKWDGSSWSALGSGMSGEVEALAGSGSDLFAGGNFTTAGGKVSAYTAKAIVIPGDWLRVQNGVPGPHTNALDYVGVPNAQYLVQFATNLTTSPWFTLATNTVAANGRGSLMDPAATNGQRFYRITTP